MGDCAVGMVAGYVGGFLGAASAWLLWWFRGRLLRRAAGVRKYVAPEPCPSTLTDQIDGFKLTCWGSAGHPGKHYDMLENEWSDEEADAPEGET